MGRLLRYDMQRYSIGMDNVIWTDGDRNGLCFIEQGLGPIVAEGGYDRTGSATANAVPGEFDFSVLEHADAFFTSGITTALSKNALKNAEIALETAKQYAVPTFIDINYRKKLWTSQEARTALSGIVDRELITCLITTETDARVVFGIDRGFDDDRPMDELVDCCGDILAGLHEQFRGKVPILVMTVRKRVTNERGEWASVALLDGRSHIVGDRFDYIVLDRYGAGDSCSAGIIGGFLGIGPDSTIDETLRLQTRIQNGLNLGNRMSVVVQKTVSDLGPQWPASEYFQRVGVSREIAR
jgi:2-dehydro-3-deoxygluconokinase